jgi:hypothetical protein
MKINKKIKNLIQTSLFLSKKQEENLLKILPKLDEAQGAELLQVLESEKESIKEIIKSYIKSNGEEAIASLNRLLGSGKKTIRTSKEKKERSSEEQKLESLLDELENA